MRIVTISLACGFHIRKETERPIKKEEIPYGLLPAMMWNPFLFESGHAQ